MYTFWVDPIVVTGYASPVNAPTNKRDDRCTVRTALVRVFSGEPVIYVYNRVVARAPTRS